MILSADIDLHRKCAIIEAEELAMTKNVTLRIEETLLHKARHQAVEEEKSFSRWLTELISKTVSEKNNYQRARERAIKRLKKGFHLSAGSFKREDIYDRKVLR